jgi:2-dehydropantoate 2-reductase
MSPHFKTIAIVGTGALGLYYGGRLARAGGDVTFLARGDVEALRVGGIDVQSPGDDFTVSRVKVAAAPEEIGPVDLVVIALKATANDLLGRLLPPLLHAETAVVNFQNGLGVDEAVAAVAGPGRTLGGLCFVGVNRVAPGRAVCAHAGYVVLGELSGAPTARTESVAALLRSSGVVVEVSASLPAARWRKLVWNVPFNGLAVVEGGMMSDEILRDPRREARVRALMREIQAVAACEGVEIEDAFLENNVERTRTMPYKPSTMLDYLAGRPLELEPIWGEPLRRARAHGVPAPQLAALHEELRTIRPRGNDVHARGEGEVGITGSRS